MSWPGQTNDMPGTRQDKCHPNLLTFVSIQALAGMTECNLFDLLIAESFKGAIHMQPTTPKRGSAVSRRRFLTLAGLGTGAGLAACAQPASVRPVAIASLPPATTMVMDATAAPQTGGGVDDMDAM